jgi:protein MpaA
VLDHPLLAAARALPFEELGRSSEGRPIQVGRFGAELAPAAAAAAAGTLVVMAGIHGDEPASVEAALALARRLAAAPPPLPLLLVPALNPDGLVRSTKNSVRDVDLNRNFPARGFERAHPPGYDPGEHPLSEPETRAFAELLARAAPPVAGVVAVHAPFACVNFDGPAAAWAELVAAACGWPARGDIGYPTPGSLGSWLGVDRGLPVLTLELPPGPYAAFAREADAALDAAVAGATSLTRA